MTSYTLEEDFFESIFAPDKSTENEAAKTEEETHKSNATLKPEGYYFIFFIPLSSTILRVSFDQLFCLLSGSSQNLEALTC